MTDSKIREMIEREVEKELNKITVHVLNCYSKVMEEIYLDAIKIYDGCIDAFYLYKTKVYNRHGVGVGTKTGLNLYRSNEIKRHYNANGILISFDFGWSADDMEPYRLHTNENHEKVSVDKEMVLENVLHGYRGFTEPIGNFTKIKWRVGNNRIKTRYFGTFAGIPVNIFNKFLYQTEDVIVKLTLDMFDRTYK